MNIHFAINDVSFHGDTSLYLFQTSIRLYCSGVERDVSECILHSVSESRCDTLASAVGLSCHFTDLIEQNSRPGLDESMRLTLVEGRDQYNGVVQIVGTQDYEAHICKDDITESIVNVICRDIFGSSNAFGKIRGANGSYLR